MQKFLIAFVAIAALDMNSCAESNGATKQAYYVANPKSLDYKFTGKKDEFRFGVELRENKQFHHTKTAEDGVRLGCYGHEQDGKQYSTHYVADAKGYRLVPNQGFITVYPKDGAEPRQASFVDSFSEDEIRSANIRYFFPTGCKSPTFEVGNATAKKQAVPTPAESKIPLKKADVPVVVPRQSKTFVPSTKKSRTFTVEEGPVTRAAKASKQVNVEPPTVLPLNELSTKALVVPVEPVAVDIDERFDGSTEPPKATPATVKPRVEPATVKPRLPSTTVKPSTQSYIEPRAPFKKLEDETCSDTCCDDNRPQLLMSRPSLGSCCRGVAKIVIPIDLAVLEKASMAEIIDITSTTKNVEMLQKLLRFVEKYKL